ncbi:hypothetical protein F8154_11510 [Alkaliphilus pronyensis]|uniref:ABC transporter substrate-binding protein n=1 Tax=Alkaliphilus pronyensis TaxID=1482732 RepID=A0A6I0F8X1_9FIRM|nr:zinc ABC transporter substrate-binding protein [Alkaliphilus pronyensis]KAB3532767.1 hypothetical protein F8154_11510 [Alkaliphilus pronyensis]
MKFKKAFMILLIICLLTLAVIGCSNNTDEITGADETLKDLEEASIVASTSWTALMAEAAGAKNVTIIAPVELKHPPEYDFKPSDIKKIQEADWVIMAGYEAFMNKIIEANNIDQEKIIRVKTTNTYDNLVEQTKIIAEKINTVNLQQEWVSEFSNTMDVIMEKSKEGNVSDIRVLVHTHLAAYTKSLGYDVVEVYGAEELSPAKIGELAKLQPDLIIDNYHNPQGIAIEELSGAKRVELRNFPGVEQESLVDLMIYNAKLLNIY